MSEVFQEIKQLGFQYITADLTSFLIYSSVFALTLLFCVLFQNVKRKTKTTVTLCVLLTALPLSVLAGVRYGVGTDFYNYAEIIHAARSGSGYAEVIDKYMLEPGFNVFIFVTSRMFTSDGVVFFLMEYITLTIAFYAFARLHKSLNFPLAVSLYYLMFYNYSLNISRQMMAMSFILLAVSLLYTRKVLAYVLCCLLAFSLHFSAIVGLALGVVYFISKKRDISLRKYKVINLIYMIVVLLCALFVKNIMIAFFNLIPSLSKYARYLIDNPTVTMFSFVKGFILVFPLMLTNRYICRDTRLVFLRNCVWLYFIVATGAYYFNYVSRLLMYIRLIIILIVTIIVPKLRGTSRFLFGAYYVGLYALAYYDSFIIHNHADTFPYRTVLSVRQ